MAANQLDESYSSARGSLTRLKASAAADSMHGSSFPVDSGNGLMSNFSELDSMMAAIKSETSALDSMQERLQEMDGLRAQLVSRNQRLLGADQANLTLKTNLMKAQELIAEVKKQKLDVEAQNAQLRAEFNRMKETLQKETHARQNAQTDIISLRDQLNTYEKSNERYQQEIKAVAALQESNNLLKNDLVHIRRKYRDEKAQLISYIKSLEAQHLAADTIRGDVRGVAMRLLEITTGGSSSPVVLAMTQSHPQHHQPHFVELGSVSTASYHSMVNDEDEDVGVDDLNHNNSCFGDDSEVYDTFDDDSVMSHFGSMDSVNTGRGHQGHGFQPPRPVAGKMAILGQTNHMQKTNEDGQQETQHSKASNSYSNSTSDTKKKKKKRIVVNRQQQQQPYNGGGGGVVSLPRLVN